MSNPTKLSNLWKFGGAKLYNCVVSEWNIGGTHTVLCPLLNDIKFIVKGVVLTSIASLKDSNKKWYFFWTPNLCFKGLHCSIKILQNKIDAILISVVSNLSGALATAFVMAHILDFA